LVVVVVVVVVAAANSAAATLNQPSALTDDWNFNISPAKLSLDHPVKPSLKIYKGMISVNNTISH
jgi:hypothetical protein